jgi:zinc protease
MNTKTKLLLIALISLIAAACRSPYAGLGKPQDAVPFMEAVRTGELPSGLRYFILENSLPENRAYLTLAVKAGSVLEADDEQGLAHFVEHMAFNGTARFPEAGLVQYLRSLGMRFGPEVNAYTSFDQTVYGIETPIEEDSGGTRRIPEKALAILDDWTQAITFDAADVHDERAVIMEEYRSRLGAMERIRRKILPVLFSGSPYSQRLPIGRPEIIENAPASRLEGFYRKWYQPENMALILAGDFDGAALEASLQEHFHIQKSGAALEKPDYDLPPPQKGRFETLLLTDPELTEGYVNVYFKREREAPRGDISYFREEIIDILIDRMLSFRFEDEINKPETPYLYAGAGIARYGASSRFYVMTAEAKSGGAEKALEALLTAKESMLRYGFTRTELKTAADSLVSDLQRMVFEKDRQYSSRYIDSLTRFYIDGGNHADFEWELNAVQKLLPHITKSDITKAINSYFKSDDITLFMYVPEADAASLPSEARVREIVSGSATLKIARPKTKAVSGELLNRPPQRGSVLARSVDESGTGALVWDLSNGAKVILKATKNRNNEIAVQAMARGGTSSAAPQDHVSASLAAEMLQASGLGPWPRAELIRKLAGKQVSISPWVSHYYRGFQGTATVKDLAALFEMIYINFTDPRIDAEAVEAMLDQYRTQLAQRSENPDTVFSDEITRIVYGAHPCFKPLELDDLPQANIDRALSFLRRALNPADFTFVFTGNIDEKTMNDYIETYLASIPQTDHWNEWTPLDIQRPGKVEKTIYKGKEERSQVYMTWFAKHPYTEEGSAAAQVLNEYLDIVMTTEIREKLGGVYSVSVGASLSPVPEGELSLSVYFICDPRRVDELCAAVEALLNKTAVSGGIDAPDSGTFTKAQEALKKEWETSIQSNAYLAQSYANSAVLLKLPLARLDRRPQYYSAVTPADIRSLCAEVLRGGPAKIVLYPEK